MTDEVQNKGSCNIVLSLKTLREEMLKLVSIDVLVSDNCSNEISISFTIFQIIQYIPGM
jgi:hypothetical protein